MYNEKEDIFEVFEFGYFIIGYQKNLQMCESNLNIKNTPAQSFSFLHKIKPGILVPESGDWLPSPGQIS